MCDAQPESDFMQWSHGFFNRVRRPKISRGCLLPESNRQRSVLIFINATLIERSH